MGVHILAAELQVQLFNFHISETKLYILLKLVQFTLNKYRNLLTVVVKIKCVSVELCCTEIDLNFGVTSVGTQCIKGFLYIVRYECYKDVHTP